MALCSIAWMTTQQTAEEMWVPGELTSLATYTVNTHILFSFTSGIKIVPSPKASGVFLYLHLRTCTVTHDIYACLTSSSRQCVPPGMSPGLSLVLRTWDGLLLCSNLTVLHSFDWICFPPYHCCSFLNFLLCIIFCLSSIIDEIMNVLSFVFANRPIK